MMLTGARAAWREVKSTVLGLSTATSLALLRKQYRIAFPSALLLGGIFFFFRDPGRRPPSTSPEWILAPADGKVTHVELIYDSAIFNGVARRISIFLSLFDVHVQRSPCQGVVQTLSYQAGSFAPAFLKDTRANESNLITFSTPYGPVGIKQIAGILARRIVCWSKPGDELARGQRLGLIKFGSRVDLLLPPDVEILVSEGEKVYGGQTIVGRWPNVI